MENEETEKLTSSKAVIAHLAEQFPHCFTTTGEAKPLKIGIFEELAKRLEDDPKVSKTRLRSALRQYTNSWRYLRSVKAGTQRVDLDGADAGTVEEEHAQHAQETLAESKARAAEQRKAAGSAQNERSGERKNEPRKARSKTPARKQGAKPKAKAKQQAEPKLESVNLNAISVGQNVQVKVGQSPMPGTVSAIEKSEVQVQLMSGITVKVKIENVFVTS